MASDQRQPRRASVKVTAAQSMPTAANGRMNGRIGRKMRGSTWNASDAKGGSAAASRTGVATEPSRRPAARQHARQHEQEQDPRQEIRHRVLLEEQQVLEHAHRQRARRGGSARRQRQVVIDLAAEREVPPHLGEVPDVRRDDDDEHEDGGAQPRQDRPDAFPSGDDHEHDDHDEADEVERALGPHQVGQPEAETRERDQRSGAAHQPSPRGQHA